MNGHASLSLNFITRGQASTKMQIDEEQRDKKTACSSFNIKHVLMTNLVFRNLVW